MGLTTCGNARRKCIKSEYDVVTRNKNQQIKQRTDFYLKSTVVEEERRTDHADDGGRRASSSSQELEAYDSTRGDDHLKALFELTNQGFTHHPHHAIRKGDLFRLIIS